MHLLFLMTRIGWTVPVWVALAGAGFSRMTLYTLIVMAGRTLAAELVSMVWSQGSELQQVRGQSLNAQLFFKPLPRSSLLVSH